MSEAKRALSRLRRNRRAMVCLGILALEVLAVLLLALCRREAEGHPAALAALLAELSLPAEPEQLGAAVRRRLEKVPSTKNLLVHTA